MKKLFENWNRFLSEADYGKWKRQPRGGGRGYGDRYASDKLTKFEDRLRSLGIDDARHLVQFLIGLVGMGDDPAEWAEGERQQTLDDITAVLARESDPQQTPVSDEELLQMQLSRELVLLRIDNKKARSIMKSIRDLLTLSDEEQEEIINELMMFTKPKEEEHWVEDEEKTSDHMDASSINSVIDQVREVTTLFADLYNGLPDDESKELFEEYLNANVQLYTERWQEERSAGTEDWRSNPDLPEEQP